MRRSVPVSVVGLGWLVAVAGCHLTALHGPVPADLASSRKLSQQGITSLERGQSQEAETVLAKAVKTCPTDPDARRYYGEALWLRGARPEAVAQLEEACRLSPDDPAVRVRLADMYLAIGRVDLARTTVEQVIDLNPKLPGAWATRGRISRVTGDLRQALADYHRALGYAPGDRQILLETAEVYRQQNEPQRALETLQSLADTYSPGEEPQQVFYLLGLAYVALQRYDDGIDSFLTALARDRPTPEILYRLGEAQWLAGQAGNASGALQQALAIEPRHEPSRALLARIALAQQVSGSVRR